MCADKNKQLFIAKSFINSFHYLAQDADYFRQLAHREAGFERVRICRTTILLYVLSLEALINRCMDHFLPDHLRDFFLEREKSLSPLDKFQISPLLVTGKEFDKSEIVWAKLKELFKLRNDFVHPKHDRAAYVKFLNQKQVEPLDPPELPPGVGIKPSDIQYPNLKVPKDPYSILPEHLDRVKEATGDLLQKLNELLDGKVLKDSWHTEDKFTLVYPEDAAWSDLPSAPAGTLPRVGHELRAGRTERE